MEWFVEFEGKKYTLEDIRKMNDWELKYFLEHLQTNCFEEGVRAGHNYL